MKLSILIIIIFGVHYTTFSQKTDSVFFEISKVENSDVQYKTYRIHVFNGSSSPVCILHSAYINLGFDQAPKLALFGKDTPYTLLYTARDTLNDYENTNDNFDAEPVLPRQTFEFNVLIPTLSNKENFLKFDYLFMKNFCYDDFKKSIFKNANTWHQKYRKLSTQVRLPSD